MRPESAEPGVTERLTSRPTFTTSPSTQFNKVLLDEIRAATAEDHAALEADLPLMNDDLTLDTYRSVVERFLGFVDPFEKKLWSVNALESSGILKDTRQKTHLLERDLDALGHTRESINRIPRATELPRIDDLANALGAMYVIEGSTLGGQVIGRHLKTALGIDETSGSAYFTGYGRLTSKRWKEYLTSLSSLENHIDGRRAVEAARSTFSLMRSWLCTEHIT